jgi:hypothetical protein
MSELIATLAALGLYVVVLIPLVIAARPGRTGDAALAALPIAALVLAAWQFGWFGGYIAPPVPMSTIEVGTSDEAGCRQVQEQLSKGHIVTDDHQPGQIVVDAALWAQVPDQLRSAITDCYKQLQGPEAGDQIKVIEK